MRAEIQARVDEIREALALIRTGCFLAGCDHGKITGVAWAVRFPAGSPAWRDHGSVVAEEHEGLHDLGERAADRVRRALGRGRLLLELLEPRLGSGLPEERGDALDRIGPAADRFALCAHPSSTK